MQCSGAPSQTSRWIAGEVVVVLDFRPSWRIIVAFNILTSATLQAAREDGRKENPSFCCCDLESGLARVASCKVSLMTVAVPPQVSFLLAVR